jgi:hypothetical protein
MAADNDVQLILRMRRLHGRTHRKGKFYPHGAAFKEGHGMVALSARDTLLSFHKGNHAAASI